MDIYVIGTTHRFSPLEFREKLAFSDAELDAALDELRGTIASEAAVLSTCNRTEIYVVPQHEGFTAEQLKAWLTRWKNIELPDPYLFALYSSSAARHLLEVASGVDSQILGDIQIIAQVKQAYLAAREKGVIGKRLDRLFTTALHTGKRVKSETDLFTGAASISYAAVELARKIFHPMEDKKTLVVGAGDTGELTARSLHGQGVCSITITNRSPERAATLVETLGFGEQMPMESLKERLQEFDIVIVSTGAQEYILGYDDVRASSSRRHGRMQLIVDISMPRNVDPRVSTIPGIFCKDLNDLNNVIESNVERRRGELPIVEAIVSEELAKFATWCNLLPVTPVVAELKRQSEEIARAELERNRHRFTDEEFRNVEKLVGSVVKKIIGRPMAHLLDAAANREDTLMKAEYVRVLFNLSQEKDGEEC
jgi:glutamyl-tRNA reductase